MKKIYIFLTTTCLLIFSACTGNFEEANINPYQISDKSLQQDFNHVGAFFPSMLSNLFGNQVNHNLVNDSFVRHLGTPTPFVGGINNTTYYIRWNGYWDRIYNNIMAPGRQVIQIAEEGGYDVFVAWAKLIQILGMSRLTAYHGPVIYSDYGSSEQTIMYDSEEELYTQFFDELDEILAVFNANLDYTGMANFDASFGGDVSSWIKVTNSMRLRLAMRLSKVDPEWAKEEGEKAISDAGGLILTNDENFNISLYGAFFHPAQICFQWNDTRMSATMESVLIGYKDNRISAFFDPATDDTLYPDHPDSPYKGIRNGALLVSKDDRLTYSTISSDFEAWTERPYFRAAETQFLLAEAALRGWAGTQSAQYHYEEGVRTSFSEWGASGVDEYLLDDTSIPLNYDDPKADGDVNDFVSRILVTVMWDEADDNETKLEKVMTQKWISGYMNSIETWVDHRRTDYPKLPFNYKNDSNADWGVIAADDFLRRMPFTTNERTGNPDGVADATSKLGGPDEIGTRLWWDTGGSNF
ncbi:SusD/RagB family nutrient-binding outer membrane lipoprotein [Chondrinema litorale]|uniref:SusD/RagB family nutrient-binding outer membrane lipoprotein n=1 Tax=Chondrinema litorale TaxID=2994555 RepID=UPI0025428A25|nr:SusD/RagB family nutrient-binding outer membrane lipoprotein [Chondrinema litorale]UZR97356.1 SusD/RagB family nutrient-binding outer membrane lipoprotein [Chondrinema litorale]